MRLYHVLFRILVFALILVWADIIRPYNAFAVKTRNLHYGEKSEPLFSDRKSTPALIVQIEEVLHYGYLTPGVVSGKLIIEKSPGERYSLTVPPSCAPGTGSQDGFIPCIDLHASVSTTAYDYPVISTYPDAEYNGIGTTLCGTCGGDIGWGPVNLPLNPDMTWTNAGTAYYIQGICSTTPQSPGMETFGFIYSGALSYDSASVNSGWCFCRLKRVSDNKNGNWVHRNSSGALSRENCFKNCVYICIGEITESGGVIQDFNIRFRTNIYTGF